MKGYYIPSSNATRARHSITYACDHPLYSSCTLFKKGNYGLAVIQKRFNSYLKTVWWGPIDPWLSNDIFESLEFEEIFNKMSRTPENGLYPHIEVRKLMYALGMKPMKKEYWEDI